MITSWRPSYWGRRDAQCHDWRLELDGDNLAVSVDAEVHNVDIGDIGDVTCTPGILWATVDIAHPERRIRLRGIPNRSARKMATSIVGAKADFTHRLRVKELIVSFSEVAESVTQWSFDLHTAADEHLKVKGWLTREFSEEWADSKAALGFDRLLDEPDLQIHIASLANTESIRLWRAALPQFVVTRNERHLAAEIASCHDFFQSVETSPLTPEQERAVVCFDNRMLVIASAGSGKTSTMVAKAGYAVHRGLIPADRILMLAFNNAAAKELQSRTVARLSPLGLDAEKVVARTFHAFGMEIIGKATGKKPSLAPWLDGGGDITQLGRIVERLRSTNSSFRVHWDFFGAVLARDYPDVESATDSDVPGQPEQFLTIQGEVVKSAGERMIADWLFFNGVDYVYERPYEIDTADPEHGQYRPDFYYPQIDTYHEHWALDSNGLPPAEFTGYLDGVTWKRAVHQQNGTTLLETTMADLWSGTAIPQLAADLISHGIQLDPNADRIHENQTRVEREQLLKTFRTFLIHAKSNRLSDEQLTARLREQPEGHIRYRDTAFLRLFSAIRREWEKTLTVEGVIDFEDMLNLSADLLESGRWESPYDLVMVDEFQDASHARARLAKALVDKRGRYLFAVGDDWQSINRFAGADLSVMTGFEDWFGPSEILRLERTFRFPQSIANASSRFVLQNPSQLSKTVVSTTAEFPPALGIVSVDKEEAVAPAIRYRLKTLHAQLVSGEVLMPTDRKLTVLVLGRYQHQRDLMPDTRDLGDRLEVQFNTIHSSKGDEADYVMILGMVSGKWGFPSTIPNDPVLRLVLPSAEDFPRAEERRLFYVAMTRAKRCVMLVTLKGRESRFLLELIRDHGIVRTNALGEILDSIVCPGCGRGLMVERTSKRGKFLGCGRFPQCKTTQSIGNSRI